MASGLPPTLFLGIAFRDWRPKMTAQINTNWLWVDQQMEPKSIKLNKARVWEPRGAPGGFQNAQRGTEP